MSTFGQPTSVPAFSGARTDVPRTAPWVAAGVAAVLVVGAAGWFGVVAPQRTAAADLRDSTAQVEVNEQALTARVTDLKQQFAALPEHQAKLAALQQQLPGDAALPDLVRDLKDVAARSGVQLTSLTPSVPVALGGAATSTGQPAPADAAAGAAASAGGSSDAAGAGAATAAGTTGATGSADAAGTGLLQVPVTLTASGPYSALMTFLAGVQQEQRLFLVTGTTVTTGTQTTGQSGLVLTVTGAVFALPSSTSDASTSTAGGAGSAGAASGTSAAAPSTTTNLN